MANLPHVVFGSGFIASTKTVAESDKVPAVVQPRDGRGKGKGRPGGGRAGKNTGGCKVGGPGFGKGGGKGKGKFRKG